MSQETLGRESTVRTKGALSQKTVKLMVFTLVRAASKKWHRLNGANQLPRVIEGVKFTDGVATSDAARAAPPDRAASPKFDHSSDSCGPHRYVRTVRFLVKVSTAELAVNRVVLCLHSE